MNNHSRNFKVYNGYFNSYKVLTSLKIREHSKYFKLYQYLTVLKTFFYIFNL